MSPSPSPTRRKRGAQPGNRNRLKHGLYARQPLPPRLLARQALGLDRQELPLGVARSRLKSLLRQQAAASPRDFLVYERAILHYIDHIARLIHRNQALHRGTHISAEQARALLDLLDL